MAASERLRRVDTGDLHTGLYVVEPDRPWTEIPTLFQGFEITEQAEIDLLRTHCDYVYVDPERSERDALGQAAGPAPGADVPTGGPGTDTGAAFGRSRHPDPARFARLVRAAYNSRSQTRHFVEAVLNEVTEGRAPDAEQGNAVVSGLVRSVGENPAAALWLTNLDERDAPTSVHSVNVCIMALTFGIHLGLPREELQHVGLGALLHDVGKMCMPSEILNKPEALTDAEWQIARRHPEDGHEILKEKGGFAPEVLAIVRDHHERLDGSGYPRGRSGVDLALLVRLVALANTYDALTSERPYRSAMPADQALQRLYNEADATFGAPLVQEFIRCVGIYPVGSLVELDNGAAGVVLGSRPDARIQPTVLLVRTPDGEIYRKRVVLNLAAEAETAADGATPARHIRCALDPGSEGIDVAGIVAIEFGLDQLR